MNTKMRSLLIAFMSAIMLAFTATGAQAEESGEPPTDASVPAASADSVEPAADPCGNWVSEAKSKTNPTPYDEGGKDALARIYCSRSGTTLYEVRFQAYDEILYLRDLHTDGLGALAEVWVYDKSGDLADKDTFTTGSTNATYELGTPDGSGNVAEGYEVFIKVCTVDKSACTGVAAGIA